jgi:hypothetical protein
LPPLQDIRIAIVRCWQWHIIPMGTACRLCKPWNVNYSTKKMGLQVDWQSATATDEDYHGNTDRTRMNHYTQVGGNCINVNGGGGL